MVALTREFQMGTGNTVTLSNKDGTRTSSLFSSLFFVQLYLSYFKMRKIQKNCAQI